MALYDILFRPEPAWKIPSGAEAGKQYPGDYPGRVIGIGKPKAFGSPSNKRRSVIQLELDKATASLAGARRLKVEDGHLVPVTFSDAWGAVAGQLGAGLRLILENAENFEVGNESQLKQLDGARRIASALAEDLPVPEVHTGAGYYRVDNGDSPWTDVEASAVYDAPSDTTLITLTTGGRVVDAEIGKLLSYTAGVPGNDYTVMDNDAGTITVRGNSTGESGTALSVNSFQLWQDALDQLFAEQGGTSFTAPQVVEGFNGTYTEHVVVPALVPGASNQLVMRAAAGQTAITITGDDTSYTWDSNSRQHWVVSGFAFAHTGGNTRATFLRNGGESSRVETCVFTNAGGGRGYQSVGAAPVLVVKCRFDAPCYQPQGEAFLRCWFNATVRPWLHGARFESCVFDGVDITSGTTNSPGLTRVTNCVFYNASLTTSGSRLVLQNTIFFRDDGADCLILNGLDQSGYMASDWNCIYCDKADPLKIDGTNYTFTQWQAFGHDPNSIIQDPEFNNPAGDDFTLKTTSPCRRRGAGAATPDDYAGLAFDPRQPPIGASAAQEPASARIQSQIDLSRAPSYYRAVGV